MAVRHAVATVWQAGGTGTGRRPPRRPLIGFVVLSSDVSLVGTMTSGGTDVMEMPASTSPSRAGVAATVVVVGGNVLADAGSGGMVVVATVAGTAMGASDGVVDVARRD